VTTIDQLLENAESYAAEFVKPGLPLPPGRKVAILACMDARLNLYGLLGLREGDAHVIRKQAAS
jgi:carbonic anhydrase